MRFVKKIIEVQQFWLSSPRAKRAGPKGLRAESARAVTGRRYLHSGEGKDFLTSYRIFFTKTAETPEQKFEKSFPRWEMNGHSKTINRPLTKIGVVWQKSDSLSKNRDFGPKKSPFLYSNHVLATTGKSCSKKKSACAQIIKGGNVILGDFLG